MKKVLFAAMLAGTLAVAQQPPVPSNAQGAQRARGAANDGVPRENPSNQVVGVDIDRFIGYPSKAFTNVSHGGLMTRSMLRNGNPYNPGPNGAVLEYREDCAVATLESHFETSVFESPLIYFFYVQSGQGRIDSGPGTQSFNLHAGSAILAPPNAKQRFVNIGDKQLSMIMLTWKDNDGVAPPKGILVVDSNTTPFTANRAHWIHMNKPLFRPTDGINTTISAIYFPAMSYGGPHAHAPGVEEIWVKVGSDEGYIILGSEIRKVVGTAAFLSPPNGKTTHSSMNLSEETPSIWLYISRRAPQTTQPAAVTSAR